MRNVPDILTGVMGSQFINFQKHDSMICSMSLDIPVKFAIEVKNLYHQDCLRKIN